MIVLTLGTFDLLHPGHRRLFARCRQFAGPFGSITVALNRDDFIEAYKDRAPVQSYRERRKELRESGERIDAVVENPQSPSEPSAWAVIEEVSPDVIVVGSDWRDRDYLAQLGVTQEWLDARDCYVVFVPYTPGISTTMLREKLGTSPADDALMARIADRANAIIERLR